MKFNVLIALTFSFFVCFEGRASVIAEYSRPCCSFGLDTLGLIVGTSAVLGKEEISEHNYARKEKKDNVGIVYSCSGGFIDISHLRDNADWAAHIHNNLTEWLGSGKEIFARNEGGFKTRSVFFPKLDPAKIASLSASDKEKIVVAITYSLALLHEIASAFPLAVSAPGSYFIHERASAFSVEDAFSNLLGAWLGAQAAGSGRPFNQAMTELINDSLKKYDAQSHARTTEAFTMVRNDWWTKTFYNGIKNVLRRDFTYEKTVTPRLVDIAYFCPNLVPDTLEIPERLSDGTSVNDYFETRGVINKRLNKYFNKWGLVPSPTMTQKDFPLVIETIKKKLVEELGEKILYSI